MAYRGSCRFLFHQFIQWNESHKVIADADFLPPLSAAFVGRSDIDCFIHATQIMSLYR